MNLKHALTLLDDNGIQYILTTEPNKTAFYRHSGKFQSIMIPNPNHAIGAQLIFDGTGEDARFDDLEFGGYPYELFDTEEKLLAEGLMNEIHHLMSGTTYIIIAKDTKTSRCLWVGMYDDSPKEEENTMEYFRRAMEKIRMPKSWVEKLLGRSTTYEVYNWHHYEKIVK